MSHRKAAWIGTLAVPTAAAVLIVASIAAMVSRIALPESLRPVLWIQGALTHYLLLFSAVLAVLLGDKHLKKFGLRSSPLEFLVKASIAGFALGGLSDALSAALRVRGPELSYFVCDHEAPLSTPMSGSGTGPSP